MYFLLGAIVFLSFTLGFLTGSKVVLVRYVPVEKGDKDGPNPG